MKDLKRDLKTAHLRLSSLPDGAPGACAEGDERTRALIARCLADLPQREEGARIYETLAVSEKKSGELRGCILFSDAGQDNAELHLSLFSAENAEKTAAEALRGAVRWIFRAQRDLRVVETWANPDLSSIRVLEKAGFERVFDGGGAVRYEKKRSRPPLLMLTMLLCTLLGVLFGYIFDNYPLCIAVGIAAGILPGALMERALTKKKR